MNYHIWTIGCQMNTADSQRLGSELEKLGYRWVEQLEAADVIVLNTCVVRQQAEDKIYGRLGSLRPIKAARPDCVIGLMGCVVGHKPNPQLARRFPLVDVFIPPSETAPLIDLLRARALDEAAREIDGRRLAERWALQDGPPAFLAPSALRGGILGSGGSEASIEPLVGPQTGQASARAIQPGELGGIVLPQRDQGRLISAHVPVVYGCNWVCTFCIIPSRRGPEQSRPLPEIVNQVRSLVDQGVREVTLLGQIVDRYGYDWGQPDALVNLLEALDQVDGLARIRFLTSHPKFMSDALLDAVARLPKVMEHIEVPVQAGDDEVLARMKRGYRVDDYRQLVSRIRERIPGVAIHTDIIVGFPGESEAQYQATYDLLEDLALDKVHLAKFSMRPGTVAAKTMVDDVPDAEKEARWRAIDALQERVCARITAGFMDREVQVLVETRDGDRWRGRTRGNKLVYFTDPRPLLGQLVDVRIFWTGPWSMIGRTAHSPEPASSSERVTLELMRA